MGNVLHVWHGDRSEAFWMSILVGPPKEQRVGPFTTRTFTGRFRAILPILTGWVSAIVVAVAPAARADTVMLKAGGLVRGRLKDSSGLLGQQSKRSRAPAYSPKTIALTTMTGGRLVLETADVLTVNRRPMLFEEYEVRSRRTPDETESLWMLAEWCKNKGLKAQREETLRRLLVIDPEHLRAHQGLGQTKRDGKWRTHDEEMRSRGFVKFEGRYVAIQEVDILKNLEAQKKVDQDWNNRIRNWTRASFGSDPEKRRIGWTQLANIHDPGSIPALNRNLRASDDPVIRELYIKILTQIPGPAPVPFLVSQSLFDVVQSVRVTAQQAIKPELRAAASPLFARELRNTDNVIVRRAGLMLEKVGDEACIPALINAVVTTHSVAVQVPDNSNTYSFGNQNSMLLPPDITARMLAGNPVNINPPLGSMPRTKTVLVDRDFRNSEVLAALQTLTKESFGYDKDLWRRWWATRTTLGQRRVPLQP